MLEAKRRSAIFLLLAFILAAATGYLVLEKVKELNAELGGMTSIYVAKGNIPSRTLINESQITKMDIPNKFVTDSHILSDAELVNQVSIVPLNSGDIVTKNMIKPVSNLQNENNRLVTMYRTDNIQFDQVLAALDRVDIIVSTNSNGKRKTEIFMKDVLVAFAQGSDENFAGVAVEIAAEDAPKLIHMQNYADHIRVLKANVGQSSVFEEPSEHAAEKIEKKPDKTEGVKEDKTAEKQADTSKGAGSE